MVSTTIYLRNYINVILPLVIYLSAFRGTAKQTFLQKSSRTPQQIRCQNPPPQPVPTQAAIRLFPRKSVS